MSKDIF